MKQAKELRTRVAKGESVYGTFMAELKAAGVPAVLARGGMNFFIVDTEHGVFSANEVRELIAAGKRAKICPFVRVPLRDGGNLARMLDAGAEGLLIPMCRSLDDVQEAVLAAKYPPDGQRGAHFLRPHHDFRAIEAPTSYMAETNHSIILGIQIETLEAVELVDEIAATDGVDMLYIGPGDLSIAMGLGCQPNHARIFEVAERVVEACRKYGKIPGGHVENAEVAQQFRHVGLRVIGCAAALGMLLKEVESFVQDVHKTDDVIAIFSKEHVS